MLLVHDAPRLKCLHDRAGKFQISFDGKLITGHSMCILGVDQAGAHYLTLQFPLPCVELGEVAEAPKPTLVVVPTISPDAGLPPDGDDAA